MRPVLKMPLLQEEAAAVMTTKLMMPGAAGMPIRSNTLTNGLTPGLELVPGKNDMMAISTPM